MADSAGIPDPVSRRALAAIVFTDIVGFSARMSRNETATLEACQKDLGAMRQMCKEGQGQVLKSTGDGLLMYFPSAVDAVRCALDIQRRFADRAAAAPDAGDLTHRIGIHVGDVFFSKRDVMGDGVNIAARLQEQAEPGGIVISNTVYDLVKGRVELEATYLGPRDLKNIKDQVPIYKLLIGAAENGIAGLTMPDRGPGAPAASRTTAPANKYMVAAGVAMLAAIMVAGIFLMPLLRDKSDPSQSAPTKGGAPAPPAAPPTREQIATTSHAYADKYDYQGMLDWMKQHAITDSDLTHRYTRLAMLRETFDKAIASTSREKPLDAQLKIRNMQSLQVWREPDGKVGIRRVKVEAIHTIESLPKMDMFTILFSLSKTAEGEDPSDKTYREALVFFADVHQLSSPAISRLRNQETR